MGRAAELAALTEGLARARDGRGSTVLLTGEPGVGKSRLLRAVRERCDRAGSAALVGRAADTATASPFRALTEALLGAYRMGPVLDDPDVAPFRSALARLVPDGAGAPTTPDAPLLHVAEGFLRVARSGGRNGRGCAVLLDDLQWADAETLAVCEYLADNVGAEPVLVVIASRRDPPERLRAVVDRRAATEMALARLAPDEVVELTRACLGDASVPSPLLDLVLDRADGLPFFVEELLTGLASDGALVRRDGRWVAGTPQRGRPPVTFQESVRRRFATLSIEVRELLVDAALLGRRIDPDLLATARGSGRATVQAALRQAGELGLVETVGRSVRFRHALTRDVLLAGLRDDEHATRSGIALATLVAARPDLPDELVEVAADLAEAAGERAEAVRLWSLAAGRASDTGALTSAEAALRRAVALAAGTADELDVAVALVRTLARAARVEDAFAFGETLLARLVEDGPADPDGSRRQDVHTALARAAVSATDWPLAVAHLERARALAPSSSPAQDTLAAIIYLGRYRLEDAARPAASAVRAAEAVGDADALCEALLVHGRCLRTTDTDAARRAFERAVREARRTSRAHLEARALTELGFVTGYQDFDESVLLEARALAEACGAPETEAVACQALAAWAMNRAAVVDAVEYADAAIALARRYRLGQLVPATLVMKAAAVALRGDVATVESLLAEAEPLSRDEPTEMVAIAAQARATCAFAVDDLAAAAAHLAVAADRARTSAPTALLPMLPLHLLIRVVDGADPRPEADALAAWTAGGSRVIDAITDAVDAVVRGRAGDAAGAVAGMQAALDRLAQAPFVRAVVARLSAGAAADDRWGDPAGWLDGAAATFERLGLAAPAASCRAEARRSTPATPPGALTAREEQVLGHVRDGRANREIASRLVLSVRTVEKHVERLLAKTGSANRAQLATYALRRERDT